MKLSSIRTAVDALKFVQGRIPNYLRAFHADLGLFEAELARVAVGTGVAAVAGLLCIAFVSVAVIVTAWDSRFRITAAWLVCLGWAVIVAVATRYALTVRTGPKPFASLSTELLHDLHQVESMQNE